MSTQIRVFLRQNVLGLVAIFIALSGTAYATHPGGANTVSSGDIINDEVRTQDIAAGHVTSQDIATGEVLSEDIGNGQVALNDLAANSVSSGKIVDGGVHGVDVADNSLTGADINDGTLDTALRLDYDQPETDNMFRTVGTQNELTISAACSPAPEATVFVRAGSTVDATINWSQSEDTGGAATVLNDGEGIGATDFILLTAPTGGFRRAEVQAIYRNDNRVISLDLHVIANDVTGRCQVQGTAVEAS